MKAVVLLSGGMDSALAAKVVEEQGIEVHGISFQSPFCICNSKSHLYQCGALFFAQKMDIPIKINMRSDAYLQMVQDPRFGYGKFMNPCIDCQIYSLTKAAEYAKQINATFLITGEILGESPDPQIIATLLQIEREAGLSRQILRPLSIKHFPPTEVEAAGIIDRDQLIQYQGIHQNVKLEPGKPVDSTHLICASGGCLLSNQIFAQRLKDYFIHNPKGKMEDMKWLKIGTHYRIESYKVILANNEQENQILEEFTRSNDLIIDHQDENSNLMIIQAFFLHDDDSLNTEQFSKDQVKVLSHAVQIAIKNFKLSTTPSSIILRRKPNLIQPILVPFEDNFNPDDYKIA
jgi:hypothetical protein